MAAPLTCEKVFHEKEECTKRGRVCRQRRSALLRTHFLFTLKVTRQVYSDQEVTVATAGSVSEGSPVGWAGKALLWVLKEGGVYGGHWCGRRCWDMEEPSRRSDGGENNTPTH